MWFCCLTKSAVNYPISRSIFLSAMVVEVDVEFCGTCGYLKQYEELAGYVAKKHPDIKLNGHEGRRASFEVKINDHLVHSKLCTLAYPDFDDLATLIDDVKQGKELVRTCKQQPITGCLIV